MKIIYLLIFLSYFLLSCISDGIKNINIDKSHAIIIINNQDELPIKLTRDFSLEEIHKSGIITDKKNDTLKLSFGDYAYFYLSNKNTYIDTLLLSLGDTLFINASNNTISKKLVRFNSQIEDLNNDFDKYKSKNSLQNKIDSLTSVFYITNYKSQPFEGNDDFSKFKMYPLKIFRENFKLKRDDLVNLIKIREKQYKSDIDYLNKKTDFNVNLISTLKEKLQIELFNKVMILYNLSRDKTALDFLNSNIFINDQLIKNTYGQAIMSFYLRKNVIKKQIDYSKSKEYIDFKEAFDYTPQYFKDSLAKYARFLSIKSMISYEESDIEIKKRYEIFKNVYNDNKLIKILNETYLLNIDKNKINNSDLKLIDAFGKTVNLKDVIKSLTGNLVYIDFWASWCAPCRSAMPSSLLLNEKFKNNGVSFIYLSIDKDLDKWKKASAIEKLTSNKHNYLVLNQENDFFKSINFNVIPRYLLFDKTGNLVHKNAPGPEGEEIKNLITKYISK
jgi:thiol-disulfide isomerase/thioredoxin